MRRLASALTRSSSTSAKEICWSQPGMNSLAMSEPMRRFSSRTLQNGSVATATTAPMTAASRKWRRAIRTSPAGASTGFDTADRMKPVRRTPSSTSPIASTLSAWYWPTTYRTYHGKHTPRATKTT